MSEAPSHSEKVLRYGHRASNWDERLRQWKRERVLQEAWTWKALVDLCLVLIAGTAATVDWSDFHIAGGTGLPATLGGVAHLIAKKIGHDRHRG